MSGHEDEALKDSDSDVDPVLDRQIRSHFREARQRVPVPGFDTLMARAAAEAVSESRTSPLDWLRGLFSGPTATWAGGAVVAGALGLFVFLAVRPAPELSEAKMLAYLPASVSISEQQLVADLNSSTRWRAPSDRWPVAEADLDILGLPDLDSSAGSSSAGRKEESTWL